MKLLKKDWLDISVISLLAANVIPLFGVLFLNWDAFFIVLLYWCENLVIGFYTILKMVFSKVSHPAIHLGKLILIPFFIIHYGGFTAGHGLFLLAIFKEDIAKSVLEGFTWPFILIFVELLLNVVKQMYLIIPSQMKIGILSLFISHGISFVYNYLLKGEYAADKPPNLMAAPYSRIIIMQFAILGGAYWAMTIGSPAALLLILVVLKTIFDVILHIRSHKKAQQS
ncbi:MAG: hypothetical protein H8D56_20210 [Planctomycetes bacterium]|nr:hypothetical protein [Planctomycetota bacterium]MBL7143738.1 hypothetical protein [Phycisphaerae bacterium]